MDYLEELKEIIVEISEVEVKKTSINEDSDLIDDFGFDSMNMISVVLEIENHFGVTIEEEQLDFEILRIVGNIIKIIEDEKN